MLQNFIIGAVAGIVGGGLNFIRISLKDKKIDKMVEEEFAEREAAEQEAPVEAEDSQVVVAETAATIVTPVVEEPQPAQFTVVSEQ